jgi:hypothetical protein
MIHRHLVRPLLLKLADALQPHLRPYDLARRVHALERELDDVQAMIAEFYVKERWRA